MNQMPATNSKAQEAFRVNARAAMERQGISLRKLSRDSGLSLLGLQRVLNKGDQGVTLDRAETIAETLGVPLVELLTPVEAGDEVHA